MSVLRLCRVGLLAPAFLASGATAQVTLVNDTVTAGLTAKHHADIVGIPLAQEWQTGGLAVGDFNRDGWPDIFWIGGGLSADRLFINDGDGTFTNQAVAWGVSTPHCGNGAAVGDYDRDGRLDIYATSFGPAGGTGIWGRHKLLHNNANGTFSNVAIAAGVNYSCTQVSNNPSGYGAAWGDYDLDGDLDLCVTSWWGADGGNRLFRNNGNGTFADVTAATLGAAVDGVWGFQPAFIDMNGDRWPELLIAADFETSRYLVNNGDGTFTDMTVASGTGLDDNGMGQAAADFDHNGLLDWYVTSVWQVNPPPRFNRGNMLYMAVGTHTFLELSVPAGVNNGAWGWGTIAVDFDHDTFADLFEVNGRPAPGSEWINQPARLFYNNGNTTFSEIAGAAGVAYQLQGRGLVRFDADRDGDQDLAISTNEGPLTYFRNVTAPIGNWLNLSFDTSTNPQLAPDGYGTRVEATIGGVTLIDYVSGNPSYLATSELGVHFGLGGASAVDELRIKWARGYDTVLFDVASNQHLTIVAPEPGDFDANGSVGIGDLLVLLASWGPCPDPPGLCPSDLDGSGAVGINDLLTLLGNWG